MIYYSIFDSIFGKMLISKSNLGVCHISLPNEDRQSFFIWLDRYFPGEELSEDSDALSQEIDELIRYFNGELKEFTFSIDLRTTPFRRRALEEVANIPYGKTASYKEIAERIGSPHAIRAVGGANANNPIPIVIPCHRVIAHNNTLGGYGGGLLLKMKLLELEGVL